jgi:ubiquinone/menaquinone biosynthesis C-methylase UbiE
MNYKQVKNHWDNWAEEFGTSLRATTKSMTIKQLEIFALMKHLVSGKRILDVGCGNGYNGIAFIENIPNITVVGVDYSKGMIDNAVLNAKKLSLELQQKLSFEVADALELPYNDEFDIVTTDRCIINITDIEIQKKAIDNCAKALKQGGTFLMLENSQQSYKNQNHARESAGLPQRHPPSFNLFLDEEVILPHCNSIGLELLQIDDFGSLHDLMLYVILTASDPSKDHYDEPAIVKAAEVTMNLAAKGYEYPFGSFGQNRLYVFRKLISDSSL